MLAPCSLLPTPGFPRFLPEDAPEERPGLEERGHAAADRHHAGHVPHRGADWEPMLTVAGFTVAAERTLTMRIDSTRIDATRNDATRNDAVGRYALAGLRRLRAAAADTLTPEDLAALDRLLDTDGPHSILRRADLTVRTERTVWAARRS